MKKNIDIAPSLNKSRLPGLDFLRAFAALWVLVFHYIALAPEQLKPALDSYYYLLIGWNGVDLFFVLSGFLIGTILCRDNERIKPFMVRRFFRIYPAYILIVIICIIVNKPYLLGNWLLLVSHLFLFNNIIPGYGGAVNGVLWTLGAEFQFYILAALILLLPRKRNFFWYYLSAIVIIGSFMYRWVIFDTFSEPSERFFLTTQLPGMFGLFGVGFLAVQLKKKFEIIIVRFFPIFLSLGITLFFVFCEWLRPHLGGYWEKSEAAVYGRFFSGITFAYIVLVFSCTPKYMDTLISRSGFMFIGEISYGIYLTHLFFIDLLRPHEEFFYQFNWTVYALLILSLTLSASTLIYFAIEKPFIKLGAKISKKIKTDNE